MRRSLAILAFLSLGIFTQAQKGKDTQIPSFGTVDKSELELTECSFDPEAEALILVEDGELAFLDGLGLYLEKRVRIKILKKEGLDRANVHLRYFAADNDVSIKDISAQTYNLDPSGKVVVTKVDKKQIFDKKINKRWAEKVFTFPEVKVGSIIEYKYKHNGIGLINWYFQHDIPVKTSQYVLDFPEYIQMRNTPFCSRKYERHEESKGTRTVQTYIMREIPGFRNERYVINDEAYMDRLETTMSAYKEASGLWKSRNINWVQVIRFLMDDEDFGVQLKREIPRTADLDLELSRVTDEYQRMKIIHQYVRKNMTWNEYYGIWALDGVKAAWKDKKGTSGEINLILVNLLRDAGLNAKPVLVSTHDNGLVNSSDAGTYEFPGFNQFNKVLAHVTIGNKVYVLDGSEKETPTHLIPEEVLLTEGLVIEKIDTGEWGWVTLTDPTEISREIFVFNAEVDASGKLKGKVDITSMDYARIRKLGTAKKGEKEFKEKFIPAGDPNLEVGKISFDNLDSDSLPLIQHLEYTETLNGTGDYHFVSLNKFTGFEKNPFIADTRQADIYFGANQSILLTGNIYLPEGYEWDAPPKNLRMIMPDTSISITRITQVNNERLMMRINIDFKKPFYSTREYNDFHEFFKQLFDVLSEQYVYKKKA